MNPRVVKWPPCLSTIGDKRYAISGNVWIEVPMSTVFDDLPKYMVCEPREAPVTAPSQSWEVQGSKGRIYAVRLSGGVWSCSCPGYSFRRKCRHIEEKKLEEV
jgi:hypothetical protein